MVRVFKTETGSTTVGKGRPEGPGVWWDTRFEIGVQDGIRVTIYENEDYHEQVWWILDRKRQMYRNEHWRMW